MVIVGGMSLGTVLTLFVVPTFYTLLTRGKKFGGAQAAAAQAEADAAPPTPHGEVAGSHGAAAVAVEQRPSPAAGS
jgi:multidrug efflux pump